LKLLSREVTTMTVKQWLYRDGRPNWLASLLNRGWAIIHGLGVAPNYLVTLEVTGRRSGRTISLPLVMVNMNGERYLVSMLGTEAGWVRNVQVAHHRRCSSMLCPVVVVTSAQS
jgi:hypothetical protein